MSTVTQWRFILALLIASSCRVVESKVFERCELAKVLRQRHRLDLTEVAQWVCIAQHSSGFNTAAQAFSPTGGSHGLFQISDVYWCSPPGQGAGCNLPCHKLRDDNLSDDLSCVKRIYDEHHRISGDGYTAWNAYQQFCKNKAASYIQDCFPGEHAASTYSAPAKGYNSHHGQFAGNAIQDYSPKKSAKVYGRCELARELHQKHKMPMQQIPTWVCIAEHESRFNTAAVGRLNADGSADHGLFQISDLYWCSHDRYSGGKACGLSCNKLLDNDITDDVRCVKRIHNEHTAIAGDGFTAWTVYKPHCQNQRYEHVASCFKNTQQTTHHKVQTAAVGLASNQVHTKTKFTLNSSNPFFKNVVQQTPSKTHYTPPSYNDIFKPAPSTSSSTKKGVSQKGKVYTRCSLAQELFFKHNFPMQDISTWVCIAEHESQFNTAAIGRLNTDGSADHGLFQISDLYWCDHNAYGGKACNLPCDKLLDDDLRDDVACIKTIHEEHTRISGDGFNAWTVYKPHCQNQNINQVKSCFDAKTLETIEVMQPSPSYKMPVATGKGKIYSKCELAQELYHKHRMPMEQIPKWVCIAQHESSFNTGAVGRLNTDGSADHGLFQISDLYWCSHDQYGGKACNVPCHKLLDSDITDDVRCVKMIHEEHTRISGDGFNAWTVYKPHCRNTGMSHIKECFTDKEITQVQTTGTSNSLIPQSSSASKPAPKGKIYKKCELAQELYHKHRMPMDQIPKWVCIAQHESSYNTAAVGRLNTDGSADHGLFQVSDLYWCSHDQYGGKACNIPCDKFLDSDITDDVRCIKMIHEEHTRISGDGFNAWTVYKPHCRNTGMSHIKECFTDKELTQVQTTGTSNSLIPQSSSGSEPAPKGKIYKKCELAQELLHKHHMPMEQIPKWVCIAQHESSYNTGAVGRLNTDGSADHGLFQISDLYWCTHDQYGGKACNIPCDKFLDSDITDDVRCIQIIHEEHTRISGDGFNAWTVYKPHCRNTGISHIKECFTEKELKEVNVPTTSVVTNSIEPLYTPLAKNTPKGKIYKKCELAQELLSKHKMPMEQIPTWVCIAQHESSYNTAAVGRLNADGSLDHGLFQISDLYWCSHDQYGGKACNIPCDKLLDSDITDDVRCIKIIHEEHTRISGDGFNAWTVYKPHCRNRKMEEIRSCFTPNQIEDFYKKQTYSNKPKQTQPLQQAPAITSSGNEKPNYANNPFLQNLKIPNGSDNHKSVGSNSFTNTKQQNYQQNALFNEFQKPSAAVQINQPLEVTSKPNYKDNPFLNGGYSTSSGNNFISKPVEIITELESFKTNPFLSSSLKLSTTVKPTQSFLHNNVYQNEVTKNYLNSNDFRTTTTLKPKTTARKPPTTSWTTTKKPTTTTTRKSTTSKTTTTTKRPTTTSQKPTTTTRTTKSPKTTTTWSWQNQKSTTTKPKTTSTRSWQNQNYQSTSTTKSPRTTTTWNWQNQKYTNNATLGQVTTTKSPRTTTTKPQRTTWNWRNEQKSTTLKPLTTTANWQKWDKPTTKGTTKKPSVTTTTTQKTTNKWWNTTAKPTTARTTKSIRLDQHKTTTNRPTTAKTTRVTTTKPIRSDNYKATTTSNPQNNRPYYNDNHKTTTLRPRTTTTKSTQQKTTITTTTRKPFTTKSITNTEYSKYKNDPFSHPFFAKVNEQLKQLRSNVTTTKLPSFAASKLQSFPQSALYQDFKNSTFNKTKTIVSYNYEGSKLTTTKRPRF